MSSVQKYISLTVEQFNNLDVSKLIFEADCIRTKSGFSYNNTLIKISSNSKKPLPIVTQMPRLFCFGIQAVRDQKSKEITGYKIAVSCKPDKNDSEEEKNNKQKFFNKLREIEEAEKQFLTSEAYKQVVGKKYKSVEDSKFDTFSSFDKKGEVFTIHLETHRKDKTKIISVFMDNEKTEDIKVYDERKGEFVTKKQRVPYIFPEALKELESVFNGTKNYFYIEKGSLLIHRIFDGIVLKSHTQLKNCVVSNSVMEQINPSENRFLSDSEDDDEEEEHKENRSISKKESPQSPVLN